MDLYIAKFKFKGKKVPGREAELRKQLLNYNIVNLKAFFNANV